MPRKVLVDLNQWRHVKNIGECPADNHRCRQFVTFSQQALGNQAT
jgi:hypothetical protein